MNAFRGVCIAARAGGLGAVTLVYSTSVYNKRIGSYAVRQPFFNTVPMSVSCATPRIKNQDMVIHEDKDHGLFLILHLSPSANAQECVQCLRNIQVHIDKISPLDVRDEDNEIIAGIGFGESLLNKVYADASKQGVETFTYKTRRGKMASMPATGGDILIHAVCNEKGKLYELTKAVLRDMPKSAIVETEEVYGFRYRNGRDLSDFIDGTENPADEDERKNVAVSKRTGGSYVVTQRWIHDFNAIQKQKNKKLEDWIGRTREDSVELKPLPVHSHVGRMTAGLSDIEANEKRMVRHSMPYGTVSGESGLFFIGYSSTPRTLDWMLDRMAGKTSDGVEDSLFNFTKPVTGNYFYVPSQPELEEILAGKTKK